MSARSTGSQLPEDADEAAVALLGARLERRMAGLLVVAVVVETEAYDQDDPASHSARGPGRANAAMFAEAGTAYVYRSYGVHWCLNVSVGARGTGAAVLLRAAEVVAGHEEVRRRRPAARWDADLLRGPGCLTAGLDVDGPRHDQRSLLEASGELRLRLPEGPVGPRRRGPRVGVWRAPDRPRRHWLVGRAAVSRYRRHPRAGPPS